MKKKSGDVLTCYHMNAFFPFDLFMVYNTDRCFDMLGCGEKHVFLFDTTPWLPQLISLSIYDIVSCWLIELEAYWFVNWMFRCPVSFLIWVFSTFGYSSPQFQYLQDYRVLSPTVDSQSLNMSLSVLRFASIDIHLCCIVFLYSSLSLMFAYASQWRHRRRV